jgi:hypothetical protein
LFLKEVKTVIKYMEYAGFVFLGRLHGQKIWHIFYIKRFDRRTETPPFVNEK